LAVEGEREIEEFLAGALNGDPQAEVEAPPVEEEAAPIVVHDLPADAPIPVETTEPVAPDEGEPVEEPAAEEEGDPAVVWATKKYGEDTGRWAKAAYDQEQFISKIQAEKKQAEDVARQAIEYAQSVEAQAQSAQSGAMPLSSQEEAWIENSAMSNPAAAAYQAAKAGNVALFNGVLERVAEENPLMAANIGAQVQMQLQQEYAAAEAPGTNGTAPQNFAISLAESIVRLGIDLNVYGAAMSDKIGELGEYSPYTQAILGADAHSRDLALMSVYDLVRAGNTQTRRVEDTEREAAIKREAELRREAAGVVTGGVHQTETPKQHPFFDAMDEEWRKAGQLKD